MISLRADGFTFIPLDKELGSQLAELAKLKQARTIFINLLNDLPEGRRLHFHPHHGKDSSHLVSRNGAFLIGETVKALFQNLDLVCLEANGVHLLLGEKLLVSHVEYSRPALCVREVFAAF